MTITKVQNFQWIVGTVLAVAGLFYAAKTYHVTYDATPEISVSETLRYSISSTTNLGTAKLDFYINNKKVERATVSNFKIVNQSQIPIDPTQFHQPLTVRSLTGNEIISVSAISKNPESLSPIFKQIESDLWTLSPLLLNPGDEINIVVIALQSKNSQALESFPPAKAVTWTARVKGMKDLRVQDYELYNEIQRTFTTQQADTLINQMKIGWTITFTPMSAIAFIFLTFTLSIILQSIQEHGLPRNRKQLTQSIIVITLVLLSAALAEVATFYAFGSPLKLAGAHYVNTGVLCAYIVFAYYLYRNLNIKNHSIINSQ